MKFLYRYQDREKGVVEGEIAAPSKAEAYSALRKSGVRPMQVWVKPGLANRLAALGKRGWTIVALCTVCLVLAALVVRLRPSAARPADASPSAAFLTDATRRQVIGDAAVIQKGILDGWSDVFSGEGERFLAGFAVPGVPVSVRNTTEGEIRAALGRRLLPGPGDTIEARQIKAMVEGMKAELREFLADGGSVVEYGRELVRRQEQELAQYRRARAEIGHLAATCREPDAAKRVRARWEALNRELRKRGIKLLTLPDF